MLFNSLDFAIFLPVVFFLYWFVTNKNLKLQNLLLVVSSFVFYGWWDWRFLILMGITILLSWLSGLGIRYVRYNYEENAARKRLRLITALNIIINLLILGYFKYYNFFVESFTDAFSLFGKEISSGSLKIILPVGISFYTFQALSYTLDVYRKKISPTTDIISFFAYVSFFPQLVAGPIERATNLLPQFYRKRKFDQFQAADGLRQILWGLFKKIVIADNCAEYANTIFNQSADMSGSTLFLGALFFTFQIYGDFSGYSDIAIGTARLFGINLMRNFAFPYFSRDIAEFWRRWHISLTTWFRDYLYIPLGGSRGSVMMKIRNTFIIFLVSGFWHGADWTFIIWGALNALYFLPLLLTKRNRANLETVAQGKRLPTMKETLAMMSTFGLTLLAWIFFRADSLDHAVAYISGIFSASLFTTPQFAGSADAVTTIILIVIFMLIEWQGREQQYAIERLGLKWKRPWRYAFYYAVIIVIILFGGSEQQFIYFQF